MVIINSISIPSASAARGIAGGGGGVSYVPIPTPPNVSAMNKTLLNTSMGSSIIQSELGTGVKVGLVPVAGYANTLRMSQLVGTELDPYYFITETPSQYGLVDCSAIATGNCLGQTGAIISDWCRFHRLRVLGNTGITSMTGFKWIGKAGGSNAILEDVILANMQSPNLQFNGDGDAGTYGYMRLSFVRALGSNVDNEGFYCGDTSTSGYGVLNTVYINHGLVYNRGWDGIQVNSTQNCYIGNCTVYDVGKAVLSGQKSLIQLQNLGAGAVVENCIFWGAPQAFQIAARDITFRKCIFYSAEEGFYQDTVNNAGYTSPLAPVGGTVTFDQCEFYSSIPRTYGFRFQENFSNLVCTNCKIGSNISTGLVFDNRTDKITYSLSQTGTTVGIPITPTFSSFDPMIEDHGLVNEMFYRTGHYGYRN